jgi:hypothetical protein
MIKTSNKLYIKTQKADLWKMVFQIIYQSLLQLV